MGRAQRNDVEVSGQHGVDDAVHRAPAGTVFDVDQLHRVVKVDLLIMGRFQPLYDEGQRGGAEDVEFVFQHEVLLSFARNAVPRVPQNPITGIL